MDRLEFHVVQDRQLIHHDDIVMLFHETSDTKDKGHVLDPSHVHYRIVHIALAVYCAWTSSLYSTPTVRGAVTREIYLPN